MVPPAVRSRVEPLLQPASTRGKLPVSKEEAQRKRDENPGRIPVICERSPYSFGLPELTPSRLLLSGTMLCGEVKMLIHKKLSMSGGLPAEQTIYLFVEGLAPKSSTPLAELDAHCRADDGFLYIKYAAENTLGYLDC